MAKDTTKSSQSAEKTSSAKSKQEWSEPLADWIPIGRAVFRFGIAEPESGATTETPAKGPGPFSRQAFEQSRDSERASSLANDEPKPPSLEELTQVLQRKTHARKVEIDQEGGTFRFSFDVPGGGAWVYGVTPWVLLAMPDTSLTVHPRIEAEALFNTEGLVRISDEEAAYQARQNKSAREATGLVWRRYMLSAFDRRVSAGDAIIYARVGSATEPLRRLPSDLWPQLDVMDWQHGNALDPAGALYFSLHAADAPLASTKQQSIVKDEKKAIAALADELRGNNDLRKADAMSLLDSMNLRVSARRFQSHVWPNAREIAGLPSLAPPGRKSSH